MNSANKGEWSELYAFGYLLLNGGGHGADENAKPDKSIFYKVLQIVDNPTGSSAKTYSIEETEIQVMENGVGVIKIKRDKIKPTLHTFFNDLVAQSGSRAFGLASGDDLLKLLARGKLSASSALAQDIQLVLEDNETQLPTPLRSFSIKSELGSPATIFNASGSTNLVYQIISNNHIKPFADVSPVKSNLIKLVNQNVEFKFIKYENQTFHKSLENIDSNLPAYLAELMLSYYLSKTTNLENISKSTWAINGQDGSLQIGKIKKFLSAISMGLRAGQLWSGYPEDFGGLLLVKEDGDVLFYYLYNLKKFEEYLYKNLRFETPSATRHKFGQIYDENGKQFIKLNLQIRF